jgi:hypothetical protein
MDATFYLASGVGPHRIVLLLHALPGYENSGNLAQSTRRADWNVLLFHYRETWGTAAHFRSCHDRADDAAVKWLGTMLKIDNVFPTS